MDKSLSRKILTKTEALQREKFLKSGQGRAWLDKRLSNYRRGAGVVFSRRLIRLWRKREV